METVGSGKFQHRQLQSNKISVSVAMQPIQIAHILKNWLRQSLNYEALVAF